MPKPFRFFELSLELVCALRGPLDKLKTRDAKLHDQLRRAVTSVPLNISEGRRRLGADRTFLFSVASGSAAETRACLQVAEAFGYFEPGELAVPLDLVDQVLAIAWRLTH